MKLYKTAKLEYDRNERKFIISRGPNIEADSLEEAILYCNIFHSYLVVEEELDQTYEVKKIGKYYFNFNYN